MIDTREDISWYYKHVLSREDSLIKFSDLKNYIEENKDIFDLYKNKVEEYEAKKTNIGKEILGLLSSTDQAEN